MSGARSKKAAAGTSRRRADREIQFLRVWRACGGGPEPVREYRFHPVRKWRFDFAWPSVRLAVEIHGGTFVAGRHNRGTGIQGDCEKNNAAVLAGWRVLAYTSQDLDRRPVQVVEEVREALRS